jgi:hypothetical protein
MAPEIQFKYLGPLKNPRPSLQVSGIQIFLEAILKTKT